MSPSRHPKGPAASGSTARAASRHAAGDAAARQTGPDAGSDATSTPGSDADSGWMAEARHSPEAATPTPADGVAVDTRSGAGLARGRAVESKRGQR